MWEPIYEAIGIYFLCTIAVERTTEVITEGEIFAPLRSALGRLAFRDEVSPHPIWKWVHKLVTCSYCMSHWVSFVFTFYLPGRYFLINWLALVGLSNVFHAAFNLLYRGRVVAYDLTITMKPDDAEGEPDEGDKGSFSL